MLKNKIIMVLGGLLLSIGSLAPTGTMLGGSSSSGGAMDSSIYECPSKYTFTNNGETQKLKFSKISVSTGYTNSKNECRIGCQYKNDLITINVELKFKVRNHCEMQDKVAVYY